MSATSSKLPDKWWLHLQGERVYYLMCGGVKLKYVIGEIDYLYDAGYRILNIFVPYHGEPGIDGPPSYCGLAPLDYYNVDPTYGTNEEWAELIETAHAKGMAVIMWINLGYTSLQAEYWEQAQHDQANGVRSKYSRSFYWSTTGKERLPRYFRWIYDDVTGQYYAARWGQNPQYDWGQDAWPPEAEKVLRHWLDTGVDGFVIDAAHDYLHLGLEQEQAIITGIPASYGNRFILPEGTSGGNPKYWIGTQGYTHVFDNVVTDWDDETYAAPAIRRHNPSYIERHLQQVRDVAVTLGGGSYSTNGVRGTLRGDQRQHILQAAVLVGTGVLMQIDGLVTYNLLWADTRSGIDKVFQAANTNPALAPGASREQVPTNDDTKYYAVMRTTMDGTQHVLNIFNFQDTEQTITVNLAGSGITVPQTPVDLLNGGNAPDITDASYTVRLPSYGFVFCGVMADQ